MYFSNKWFCVLFIFNIIIKIQWRFCEKFALRNLKICEIYSDRSSADQFVNEFSCITAGYSRHSIFHFDETGLYFRILPVFTLASVRNRLDGTKNQVTINANANASWNLIGKAINPRCFNNLNKEALPVVYWNQINALVDCNIFWYCFLTVLFLKQNKHWENLDNNKRQWSPLINAHPCEEELISADGKISVFFLPLNVIVPWQQIDQIVLKFIKRVYRKSILIYLVFNKPSVYKIFPKKI